MFLFSKQEVLTWDRIPRKKVDLPLITCIFNILQQSLSKEENWLQTVNKQNS